MNKNLKLTIAFWLNFFFSPVYVYVINGLTFFQIFNSGTLPFAKPSLMPGLMLNTFFFLLLTSYLLVGTLAKKNFMNGSIMNNRSNKITTALMFLGIILMITGIILKLITGEIYQIAVTVNDFVAVIAMPLLIWLNYKFWKSNNQKWVLIGLLIQTLCVCLFMQGFYSSVW
ncbi:hypothetical protein OF387_09820 [Lentilactobacillus hilgardii]|nr:hypothetical protein [Lentilactobacillus hilgardii]MCV3741530.1 hypothetical protein [Lentilactobacillus hilgardii]